MRNRIQAQILECLVHTRGAPWGLVVDSQDGTLAEFHRATEVLGAQGLLAVENGRVLPTAAGLAAANFAGIPADARCSSCDGRGYVVEASGEKLAALERLLVGRPPPRLDLDQGAITPEDATDDVALDSAIVLSFSEAMNTDTLVASTTGVPGSVRLSYQDACLDEREVYTCLTLSEDLRQLTVIPVPPELLPGDADLDVSVDAATVSDLAGNLLDLPFHATFTTRSGAPRLSCSVPEDGDESVDPSAVITMRFSEPIDQSADFSALFALWESDEGTEVSGTFSFPDASTVLFDPSGDLTAGTCYEFLLEPGYTDLDDQSADRVERGSFSTLP